MYDQLTQHITTTWGYYAVFGLSALEGFGFFFLPGETMLMAAAVAAAGAATAHLNIVWVLIAAFCGAILGDNFSFWVGHKLGFELLNRHGHYIKLDLKRLKFVQYLYLRYGIPIVFIGRFVMLMREWESFLAGANAMPWGKFALVNAAAVLVWVCVWGLGAYGLGKAGETVLEAVGGGISVAFFILLIVGWIYFHRHEEDLEAVSEKALPGPLRARPAGSKGAKAAQQTSLPGAR